MAILVAALPRWRRERSFRHLRRRWCLLSASWGGGGRRVSPLKCRGRRSSRWRGRTLWGRRILSRDRGRGGWDEPHWNSRGTCRRSPWTCGNAFASRLLLCSAPSLRTCCTQRRTSLSRPTFRTDLPLSLPLPVTRCLSWGFREKKWEDRRTSAEQYKPFSRPARQLSRYLSAWYWSVLYL